MTADLEAAELRDLRSREWYEYHANSLEVCGLCGKRAWQDRNREFICSCSEVKHDEAA